MPCLKGSLVIPSLDRANFLLDTVRLFLEMDLSQWEILIIDQSDVRSESLCELARTRNHLSYHHIATKGLPHARNLGIEQATGDIVAFVDDDVMPGPEFLSAHLAAYEDEDVGGVAGRIIDPSELPRRFPNPDRIGKVRSVDGRFHRNFHAVVAADVDHARGCNMSFRRNLLGEIGGFDGRFGGTSVLEDADITARIRKTGHRMRFCPQAVVIHLRLVSGGCRPTNLRNYYYWYGHNYFLYALKNLPRIWTPIFLAERVVSLFSTAVRNWDFGLLSTGLRGLQAGYRSFLAGA